MTLRDLKPIEKNGSGKYEPKAGGVVLSLSGVVAAIALSVSALVTVGEYKSTLEWNTDRTAKAVARQHELDMKIQELQISVAEIKTILNERTSRRGAKADKAERLNDSI